VIERFCWARRWNPWWVNKMWKNENGYGKTLGYLSLLDFGDKTRETIKQYQFDKIMKAVNQSFKQGFNYHRNMIARDPELMEWVKKEHHYV
jgi:hypothetical protein